VDDAELAWCAVTGDRAAWAEIYDRYADGLHDHCYSILRDRQEAADALHEAFLTVATKIGRLPAPERLRPWLYGICRTQALAMVQPRLRELPRETDPAQRPMEGLTGSEHDGRVLRQLVWDAVEGLAPRDRALLDLYLRHGMDGQELGEVLGLKPHQAAQLLSRVRDSAERSLSALLVSWCGRGDCAHLNGLLVDWDGNPTPPLPKRVVRHIDGCGVCGDRRKRMVSPLALLSSVPLLPAPPELREPVLDGVELRSSRLAADGVGEDGDTAGEDPLDAENAPERRWPAAVAGVLVAMILIGALAFAVFKPGQQLAGPQDTSSPPVTGPSGPAGPSSLASVIGSMPTLTVPTTTSTTAAQTTSTRATTTTARADSQPPEISNVSADQRQLSFRDSSCSTAEATARVTDESSLSVALYWQTASGDLKQEAMSPRPGNRFTATIGPVQGINDGPIQWWVVATDSGGSSTRSGPQSVQVAANC
jgi:RNA polymerase sigma factor (sigma-70 family)